MTSVITPTYFTLIEGTCEVAALADLGEEEENKGQETAKDLDVEIYYSHNSSLLHIVSEKNKGVDFYSKNYTSFLKKLVSPPPELVS